MGIVSIYCSGGDTLGLEQVFMTSVLAGENIETQCSLRLETLQWTLLDYYRSKSQNAQQRIRINCKE